MSSPISNKLKPSELIIQPNKSMSTPIAKKDQTLEPNNTKDYQNSKPSGTPFSEFVKRLSPIHGLTASPNLSIFKPAPQNNGNFIRRCRIFSSPLIFPTFPDSNQFSFMNTHKDDAMKIDFSSTYIDAKKDLDDIIINQDEQNSEKPQESIYQLANHDTGNPTPKFDFTVKKSKYLKSSLVSGEPISNLMKTGTKTLNEDICIIGPHNFNQQCHNTSNPNLDTQEKSKIDRDFSNNLNTPGNNNNNNKSTSRSLLSSFDCQNSLNDNFSNNTISKLNLIQAVNDAAAVAEINSISSPLTNQVVKKISEDCELEDNTKNTKKRICCNCKKSRCLKLYCDCFAAKQYCQDCNCNNCANTESNKLERNEVISATLGRNPSAFKPKVDKADDSSNQENTDSQEKTRHIKGCNCKKSGCLKKYCECYQAGAKCSELCKCDSCKNLDSTSVMKKMQLHKNAINSGLDNEINLENDENSHEIYTESMDEIKSPLQNKTKVEEDEVMKTVQKGLNHKQQKIYEQTHKKQQIQDHIITRNNGKSRLTSNKKGQNHDIYDALTPNPSKKQKIDNTNSFNAPNMLDDLIQKVKQADLSKNMNMNSPIEKHIQELKNIRHVDTNKRISRSLNSLLNEIAQDKRQPKKK